MVEFHCLFYSSDQSVSKIHRLNDALIFAPIPLSDSEDDDVMIVDPVVKMEVDEIKIDPDNIKMEVDDDVVKSEGQNGEIIIPPHLLRFERHAKAFQVRNFNDLKFRRRINIAVLKDILNGARVDPSRRESAPSVSRVTSSNSGQTQSALSRVFAKFTKDKNKLRERVAPSPELRYGVMTRSQNLDQPLHHDLDHPFFYASKSINPRSFAAIFQANHCVLRLFFIIFLTVFTHFQQIIFINLMKIIIVR